MVNGKTNILFTRKLNETDQELVKSYGFEYQDIPFIEIEYMVREDKIKHHLIPQLSHTDAIIFTSKNAVKALGKIFQPKEFARFLSNIKIFAVGISTAHLLEELGFEVSENAEDSRSLANKILGYPEVKNVLYFKGNLALNVLNDILADNHISLKEEIVYKTTITGKTISNLDVFDGVAFYSPSAVESFINKNKLKPDIPVFSIGNTTSSYINEKIPNQIIQSSKPDSSQLIATINNYFNERI